MTGRGMVSKMTLSVLLGCSESKNMVSFSATIGWSRPPYVHIRFSLSKSKKQTPQSEDTKGDLWGCVTLDSTARRFVRSNCLNVFMFWH